MVEIKRPFLGVAYYPEDWDECEIDEDIRKMREAGIRVPCTPLEEGLRAQVAWLDAQM